MKEKTIVVFGDSIAYGACDYEKGGWVNRLRLYLDNNQKENCTLFNMGIPGNTTIDLLKRFDYEMKRRYYFDDDMIIIIAIGINDTQIISDEDRILISDFKKNIRKIIKKANKYTNKVFCLGLTKVDEKRVDPIPWKPLNRYSNKKIMKYDNEIKKICKIKGVKYIKLFDLLNNDDLDDGVHPNSTGYEKIFKEVLKEII